MLAFLIIVAIVLLAALVVTLLALATSRDTLAAEVTGLRSEVYAQNRSVEALVAVIEEWSLSCFRLSPGDSQTLGELRAKLNRLLDDGPAQLLESREDSFDANEISDAELEALFAK